MYHIEIEQFQGPFHLLLTLIEKEKLDITEISLAKVTDDFLSYLGQLDEKKPEEMADFLEIAAQLLVIKSNILVANFEQEEEESNLVDRLKIYKVYLEASKKVNKLARNNKYGFIRESIPLELKDKVVEVKLNETSLVRAIKRSIFRWAIQAKRTKRVVRRKIISLKQKIEELLSLLGQKEQFIFNQLVGQKSRPEKIATFLAVLELARRRTIVLEQEQLFGHIFVKKR